MCDSHFAVLTAQPSSRFRRIKDSRLDDILEMQYAAKQRLHKAKRMQGAEQLKLTSNLSFADEARDDICKTFSFGNLVVRYVFPAIGMLVARELFPAHTDVIEKTFSCYFLGRAVLDSALSVMGTKRARENRPETIKHLTAQVAQQKQDLKDIAQAYRYVRVNPRSAPLLVLKAA